MYSQPIEHTESLAVERGNSFQLSCGVFLGFFEKPNLVLPALDVREQVGDSKRGDEIGDASVEPVQTKQVMSLDVSISYCEASAGGEEKVTLKWDGDR